MSTAVSVNVRYLLWRAGVPSSEWLDWLTTRTSLDPTVCGFLLSGHVEDERLSARDLAALAAAFGYDDQGEGLRFSDLPSAGCDVLRENLRFLFGSLGHGGKRTAASALGVDPTTISRWLGGSTQPHTPVLAQLVAFFSLPAETDLRVAPVFLSADPVGEAQLRRWLHASIDRMSPSDLRDLYPALRRMLRQR